jgi:peptidoglycan L-alanyl-D-glutamate endopeptidase CwlK
MASTKIEDLTQLMQRMYADFSFKMGMAGLKFKVTCTARTSAEQAALYAQGRSPLKLVNDLRTIAGLPPITDKDNKKVTWTMNSKHITDETHPKSRAFDIVILDDKNKPTWDIKSNVNKNQINDYEEAARIGESVGLKAGARFKSPDYPHFESSTE